MANLSIVWWRDIPAQIIVRAGRKAAKRELSERFSQAIDRCAMKVGARDTDSYLAEWRRGEPADCGDDLEAEADRAANAYEQNYSNARLKELVDNGGWQKG